MVDFRPSCLLLVARLLLSAVTQVSIVVIIVDNLLKTFQLFHSRIGYTG